MKESPFSFDFNDKAKNKKQEHENKGVFEKKITNSPIFLQKIRRIQY